jgi:uncharacterized membrane protein YccF (DUF307 family)
MLSFLLNVLWIIFGGGLLLCLEYLLAGCLLCLTIVGIPFGLQCFKIAGLALFPFGKEIAPMPGVDASSNLRVVFNVIWAVVAGIWIFLTHLVLGVGLAVSIIGIPFALQHLKLGVLALAPFGRESRSAG